MKEIVQTDAFKLWESSLRDAKLRAIISARLFRLANGLTGDVKPVGEGISELRIHYGAGYRIYFQLRGHTIVVLLCGGDKSTQPKDIIYAKYLAKCV
ncbi:type II toxin-antitoxin system RelE/ParE family toxin [uncultured Kosakonia sp.]|uniref:type II toxin-antitoxin system RelE/ParE family toxin n=1 Tax=uncultured Kosakonia sp. TaxID=1588927 RepID=UPI0025931F45|nr:type II toxin-antitoxin system RelE/ParE family toxin [uncultured Kosakonia sp.]